MSRIQCLVISGRYRTQALCSHWSPSGSKACLAPSCQGSGIVETLEHILAHCGSLDSTRHKLTKFTNDYLIKVNQPEVTNLVRRFCVITNPFFSQFLIDCTVLPDVISTSQSMGPMIMHHILHITRVWCYSLHRDRLRLLGRWK